ncbi:DsbA family protein [Pelagibacterium halotolerans]|uniref:Outer membrane protein n=1 Tax=Pelagibacterium halotolerans (strain DSM 22347 / JCM 15775 / CGMCC 1.7692 / B2) TaxID=1082931 RepID=G4RDM6_PELHB|nr:thioredoxin domain-containing protein [Pelagibacterium halotolerans]AEQ52812.1 outer membrane protein [Pelagibacterium halotolerans B2]QJR17498.1 thioredoxin domain-containing protein [Pelagibacterium halotolerans]SEA75619.1 Protein-disulfide isomerase [Pelagibacterium halotolerans]
MNRRTVVVGTLVVAGAVLAGGAYLYNANQAEQAVAIANENAAVLIRPNSPIIGPEDARVTIVEFLDPACEACRAFYPVVKSILEESPEDVRLVVRYAPFHDGSEEAVGILEAARAQGLYVPVMEAIFAAQPQWAAHGSPNMDLAWSAAEEVGLDVERARIDMRSPAMVALLNQDLADIEQLQIGQTPTFFINGQPLTEYNFERLDEQVHEALGN